MESSSFDRLARLLGGAASRRAGLGIAAAALLGRGVAEAARPKPTGPCKSEKRKDNVCDADSECCTGVCDISTGKENKDGRGRCRCRRAGQACTEDKNCCTRGRKSKLVCLGGICSKPCTALGQTCTGTTTCCAGLCGSIASDESRGGGAATCCLPIGQSGCGVDTDCCGGPGQAACIAGTCYPSCVPLRGTCDPSTTNCCAGTCSPYVTTSGFEPRVNYACCLALGQTGCVDNADCCTGGAVCNGGTCQLP